MKILVIGSGFGGLAAAIRLQSAGHDVTIVERLDRAGGRAYVFEQDGFTFDAGPTIITAPWMIDELFEVAGEKTADHVTLVRVDPFYNIRFVDGSVFRYNDDQAELERQIAAWNPADVAGYRAFRARAEEIFKTGMALIDEPFSNLSDMATVLPDLVRLRADRSVAALVNGMVSDPRLQQVLSFHPLLVGGNPFATSSIYALIHTLEQRWGVWFAMGGTGALVDALVKIFRKIGGTIRFGADVASISVSDSGRVTGVGLVSGENIEADTVISNADVATTYIDLLPERWRRDRKLKRARYSMSLFVLYFGTDRKYEDIAHHEILMGPRYRDLLSDIFTAKTLSRDFSLYLHRPTATDPSLAPPGCDAWYALSPVPHLGGATDWRATARSYRDEIVAHLEDRLLPGLSSHIVTERHIDPLYFRDTLRSHLGSAFSIEPTLTQSAWFRPHNASENVDGLYLVGAGTHPGAGIPGVLSSGKIVARMIGPAT